MKRELLMRFKFLYFVIAGLLMVGIASFGFSGEVQTRRGQRTQRWQVCGDPTVRCQTGIEFQPYDLPFRIPKTAVIWESEMFYAIILKSVNAKKDCALNVSEDERLEAQALFPHNKVFADRCAEPGTLFYTGMTPDYHFMAVYAGRTRAEAERMLARVGATGRYPGANLRRMQAGFNGT
jgi:hypothetical protein